MTTLAHSRPPVNRGPRDRDRPPDPKCYFPRTDRDADRLGYELGLAWESGLDTCEYAIPKSLVEPLVNGWLRGVDDRNDREMIARMRHLEARLEALASPEATWHPSELAQAKSCSGHPATG